MTKDIKHKTFKIGAITGGKSMYDNLKPVFNWIYAHITFTGCKITIIVDRGYKYIERKNKSIR